MKRILLAAVVFGITTGAHAGTPPGEKTTSALDRMKSLVGVWKGKDSKGGAVELTYRLVSDGTVVLETLNLPGHAENMLTAYHMDGSTLMMTHYCSMGNQPRMRASSEGADQKTLDFSFVDGTDMSPDDPHMHHLAITFRDGNHITQEWTMRAQGVDQPHEVFTLERAK